MRRAAASADEGALPVRTRGASGAATALRVLQGEGLLGFRDRALDRLAAARRRRAFRTAASPIDASAVPPTPVLHLAATPPVPSLGGVQVQLLARIEREARERAVALLYPRAGRWRLEVAAPGGRQAWTLATPALYHELAIADAALEAAVTQSVAAAGARLLHVEGLAGLPLASLAALRRGGLRLLLSLHDMAAFCPRPHLLDSFTLRSCHYSRDARRCTACRNEDWRIEAGWQERRRLAEELLAAADAVVYPSEFLRRAHLELFPGVDPARHRVIAPESDRLEPPPAYDAAPVDRTSPGAPLHAAYVGSVKPHKGALVFADLVTRLAAAIPGRVRWSVYGGGDADLLVELNRLPRVQVRGYYRNGSLPRLLRRARPDVALLLSIWPEAYGLTLSECRAAGIPVVAFDHGALGDRIRAEGGGILVSACAGAAGVADVLAGVVAGRVALPAVVSPPVAAAAAAYRALYGELTG